MKTIIALLALFVSASAASITHTQTITNSYTDWTNSVVLAQFDPALGTLAGVEIATAMSGSRTYRFENRNAGARDITFTGSYKETLTAPGISTFHSITNPPIGPVALSGYDGVTDFAGTSGYTSPAVVSGFSLNTSPVDLTPYVGTGTVTLGSAVSAKAGWSGSSYYTAGVSTQVGGTVSVTYTYTP